MEMCLKRQCSAYTQSQVFEAMLEFQVHQNILRGAAETVRCAQSLDIKITVDYLHMSTCTTEPRLRRSRTDRRLAFKMRNLFSQK